MMYPDEPLDRSWKKKLSQANIVKSFFETFQFQCFGEHVAYKFVILISNNWRNFSAVITDYIN